MYSYVPGLAIVTVPDAPGWITPVAHEPSLDTIVCGKPDLFVQVTTVPALTCARLGLTS